MTQYFFKYFLKTTPYTVLCSSCLISPQSIDKATESRRFGKHKRSPECNVMVVPCLPSSTGMLHRFSNWTALMTAVGTFRGRDFKMLNNSRSTSCSVFRFFIASLSGLILNIHSDITHAADGDFFCYHSCVVVRSMRFLCANHGWCPLLSQVLCKLEEVCTVMRSLSSVIQSELLSGSLPREIRKGKRLAEYLAHLI